MKKIIRLNESDIVRIVKRVLKEQTKVSGPYKPLTQPIGDLYIIKTDKNACMDQRTAMSRNQITILTGNTCPPEHIFIPGNKYFISDSSMKVMSPDRGEYYVAATNNGQGYNSEEDAKKGVSQIMNPEGYKGKKVVKNQYGKEVSKYDKEGNLKTVKQKFNYVDQSGVQQRVNQKRTTGL
jgi:hypothetical protein